MPAPASSVLDAAYVVLRLRESVHWRRRRMMVHGRFGALHCVTAAEALQLIDEGMARLPGTITRGQLVAHIHALEPA